MILRIHNLQLPQAVRGLPLVRPEMERSTRGQVWREECRVLCFEQASVDAGVDGVRKAERSYCRERKQLNDPRFGAFSNIRDGLPRN